ncbi:FAD:protein FMN transferase [Amycolatopsis dendrobii]|uniref:FAD:protein FMN transferase n=1 Tax=Amycolatopsis dendrobii TaxID=2760662 RepID=A0A7W3ZFJ2_9PSEU|nr:FAD:protein FMN transferase [Amycolatopsis dendrobii]MBB1159540.1 FAD:protein FMN transferase [Amycolatopsis dendrobii]
MTATAEPIASTRFRALGTTAELMVTDPDRLLAATDLLRAELRAVDETCSRFRDDSEIAALHRRAGSPVRVSPLLAEALQVALRAACATDGLVDPTVGQAVCDVGYDRDFAAIARDLAAPVRPAGEAPGWWRITADWPRREVVVPHGVRLDLGATAKAWAADRASVLVARRLGCGVLIGLGGDIAVAGPAPARGWQVAVGDDHAAVDPRRDPVIALASGGLATSSTVCRTWRRAGRTVHHIVDPRTGDMPGSCWRTVTVAAGTCADANAASTAAVVLGDQAPAWLAERRLPARLVALDGHVVRVAGWPDPDEEASA